MSARALGFTTMVHAENSDIISLITDRLEAAGHTDPYFHVISRPQIAENEATYRIISLAELTDTPILIVHMSFEIAMKHVRKAQTRMLPIHAETCPQYLFLLSERLKEIRKIHLRVLSVSAVLHSDTTRKTLTPCGVVLRTALLLHSAQTMHLQHMTTLAERSWV
jgi:dihydroorotase-like cyclic amidohydrolase